MQLFVAQPEAVEAYREALKHCDQCSSIPEISGLNPLSERGRETKILGFSKNGGLYAEEEDFDRARQLAQTPGVFAVQSGKTYIRSRGKSVSCDNSGEPKSSDNVTNSKLRDWLSPMMNLFTDT